jgi:hypothetical protein
METKVLANELCFNLRTHGKLEQYSLHWKETKEGYKLTLCFYNWVQGVFYLLKPLQSTLRELFCSTVTLIRIGQYLYYVIWNVDASALNWGTGGGRPHICTYIPLHALAVPLQASISLFMTRKEFMNDIFRKKIRIYETIILPVVLYGWGTR